MKAAHDVLFFSVRGCTAPPLNDPLHSTGAHDKEMIGILLYCDFSRFQGNQSRALRDWTTFLGSRGAASTQLSALGITVTDAVFYLFQAQN